MLRPEHPLTRLKRAPEERLRGRVETIIEKKCSELSGHEVVPGSCRVRTPAVICGCIARAHVAAGLAQRMPVAGQFPLRPVVVQGDEERDVREAALEPLPVLGGEKLMRPLRRLARRHLFLVFVKLEVAGDRNVGGLLLFL